MPKPFEDWEKGEADRVVAHPLLGFDAATFPGHALLRVRYATSQAALEQQNGEHVQLAMTPSQARALGRLLTDMAEKAEQTG